MPGMGEDMDGAMQQAPQPGLQFILYMSLMIAYPAHTASSPRKMLKPVYPMK
jgi:hypothetical protein